MLLLAIFYVIILTYIWDFNTYNTIAATRRHSTNLNLLRLKKN